MRIAVVVPRFPTLSETFIMNQIIGLINKGHDVTILSFHKNNIENIHDQIIEYNLIDRTIFLSTEMPEKFIKRILKLPFLLFNRKNKKKIKNIFRSIDVFKYGVEVLSLKYLYSLLNNTNTFDFDIIHAQYGPLGIGALLLREMGVVSGEVVTSFRGFDMSYIVKGNTKKYAYLFEKGKAFFPVCEYFRKLLIENGCPEDKIFTHYSGLDLNLLKFSKLSKENEKQQILTTGRLEKKKGIEYSIKAVVELYKTNPDIEYNIIGDGSQRKKLTNLIKSLGAEAYIKILGSKKQSEVVKHLMKADIFIAPSITTRRKNIEGIPNAIKEAMLVGVPVISTYHSGIPEIVLHKKTGLLVKEKNSLEIQNALTYLIKNPDYGDRLSIKANELIREKFDIIKLNTELVELYKKQSV